jgi:site-specific DNA recombinase
MVDDYESEIVRMIFREYIRLRSTGRGVDYLHSKGIYTRQSKKWSRRAISIILSNRTYRGRVCFGGIETEGLHEPIIEPAMFYKANAIRQSRSKRRNNDSQ